MGERFAVVGDVHGHLNAMVRLLKKWEKDNEEQLDFVLQVGDFEAHRSAADLATMAAPAKYRDLGDFGDYYDGSKRMPWPLYFIGGNHEPYGFLDKEGPGEIAENIHYLGRAGRFERSGLTIVGLSGIYIEEQFEKERPLGDDFGTVSNKRYIGFVESELNTLLDRGQADILLLHDWPSGIVPEDDLPMLEENLRKTRFESLGNDHARILAELLTPQRVFCGHMHFAYQSEIIEGEKAIPVSCLANVESGPDCFSVFKIEERRITALE